MSDDSPIHLRPITSSDAGRVAEFLHRHMDGSIAPSEWRHVVTPPWHEAESNHGFMLAAGDEIAGVYLAHYSERVIDGRRERFCNLGTWCVAEAHRARGMGLLKEVLGQDGYHFTDLTPDPRVVEIDRAFGFESLERGALIVPTLPWPARSRGVVTSEPSVIERTLTGADLEAYRDHAGALPVVHVAIERDGRACYVALRRERRKRLPVLNALHISDPELFGQMAKPFSRHILLRHRSIAYAVDLQVARLSGARGILRESPERMFKSDSLERSRVDYLYTELACLP